MTHLNDKPVFGDEPILVSSNSEAITYVAIRKTKEYEQARLMRIEGMTLRAIAGVVGVDWTTVQKWVHDLPTQHRLSNVNTLSRNATCALCGPVPLRKNGKAWLCSNAAKASHDRVVAQSQERFYDYLKEQRCADCGNGDLLVLEFDHVQGEKKYNVCDMIRKGYKWSTVLDEIAKCDVVCANCHRRRTNERGGWYRYALERS